MPLHATQSHLPTDFARFLEKLESVSAFARRVPRRRQTKGKQVIGVSRSQFDNITRDYAHNWEVLTVAGYQMVYCPSGTPQYEPKKKTI